MTSTLKREPHMNNGRHAYVTNDGRFYAWKNPEWGWSVGRIVRGGEASLYGYEECFHIDDVRTLRDARLAIARLQDNDKKDEE